MLVHTDRIFSYNITNDYLISDLDDWLQGELIVKLQLRNNCLKRCLFLLLAKNAI